MHKLQATLAKVDSLRPGDKVYLGGRGPWPRLVSVTRTRAGVLLQTKTKTQTLAKDKFVRVVRDGF